jgi:hypothetical protein
MDVLVRIVADRCVCEMQYIFTSVLHLFPQVGQGIGGLNPGRGRRFFFYQKPSDWLWGLPRPPFGAYRYRGALRRCEAIVISFRFFHDVHRDNFAYPLRTLPVDCNVRSHELAGMWKEVVMTPFEPLSFFLWRDLTPWHTQPASLVRLIHSRV